MTLAQFLHLFRMLLMDDSGMYKEKNAEKCARGGMAEWGGCAGCQVIGIVKKIGK